METIANWKQFLLQKVSSRKFAAMIFAELTATFTGAGLPEGSAEKLAALIAQIAIPALYILVEGVADFISRWAARKGGDRQ